MNNELQMPRIFFYPKYPLLHIDRRASSVKHQASALYLFVCGLESCVLSLCASARKFAQVSVKDSKIFKNFQTFSNVSSTNSCLADLSGVALAKTEALAKADAHLMRHLWCRYRTFVTRRRFGKF